MDDGSHILAVAELTAAGLDYAATSGWPVFVLGAGKVPLANCLACRKANSDHDMEKCACLTCHGFYAATVDADRIIAMITGHPGGVLAVRTGAPSGVVVVDVDPRNGGDATFAGLLAAGALLPTLTAKTGSGGLHLYYAHPGGKIKSSGGALGPGVDVKADGGYTVVPPSSYDGKSYTWFRGIPASTGLAPLPDAVAARLSPIERRALSSPTPAPDGFAAPVNPAGRLAGIVTALLSTPRDSGRRNEMLNWGAFTAAEMVRAGLVPVDAVICALSEAAGTIGLAPREIDGTIRSGLRAGGVA